MCHLSVWSCLSIVQILRTTVPTKKNTGDDEVAENAITPKEQENVTTKTSHVNFAEMAQLTSGICSSSGDTSSTTGNAPTTSTPLT